MAKKHDDEFYKLVKEHLGGKSDAERAENKMNDYNKQNKATKQATIVKSTNNKKINVKTYIPKSTNTNSNNSSNNHSVINSNDLSKMENNYLNNYVSQHNYNDENVRVFTKERNQKKANELKSNINKIIQNRSNNNRLAELEVAKSKLKKKDGNGSTVEYLGEDYKKIEENKTKRKQIEDEQEAIKSGVYNAPKKIGNDDLSSAWLIHNTKENLEKNAKKALHDENIKLNNQQSKLRNAVYDTLTQDTRDKISQEQKAKAEERKRDMELQGFDNYQDMVDYNDSWKGTLSYIGRSLANSLHNFNKNITTDVRDFFGIRNELNDLGLGFINDIADYYSDVADNDNEYLASRTKYVGTGTRLAGEGTQILAQMTPQIAFALLSGGSSTAISAGEAIGNASTSAKVASSIKTMAKQPTFWTTVIQEGGNAYEEAINSGASQEEAQLSAIYTGLMNGAIEMGGGLEDGAKKGIKNWLKQGSDEGLEEVKQDFVSGLVSKGVYDNDKPMYSTEDDNAVLNPANELKAYLGGFFGGTVGSGIQRGAVKAFNKAQNAHQNKKLTNFYDNLIQSESPSQNSTEITNQTEITEAPSGEAVISEAETNQETAKRISKVIDKIDKGETVTNSEIAELKYNKTASNMLEQMAGLKESKITSALDNDTVREVINEAQNGKKNIDTASMLGNIRSNLNLTQNIAENTNENSSDAVLNADKGKLTGINKNAVESISEPYNASQSNEVGEAMPENIARNAKKNYINNIEADNLTASEETAALNDSPYIENVLNNDSNSYNKVGNDSSKIFKLGISNKKSGMTNIKKVQSIDNGVAQLLMSNGDVVSADTLDFSGNQNAEIILTNAGKYNSNSANTFIANYDSSRSTPQAYSTAFNSVYKMSKAGMSFDAVASEASAARGILGENTFNAAIRAGRNTAKGVFSDRTGSNAKNTAKTKTTDEAPRTDRSAFKLNTSSAEKNISQNNNTVKTNKIDVKKSAKEISKALGVKINVYQNDSHIRGYEKNGEIFINESWVNKKADSASEFNYIFAHELTHTLEESSYYNQLKSFILNSRIYDDSLKLRDTTHTEEVRTRQELYEKEGKKLTKEQAERELIADFIADELLTNEECIKELAYKDKKLFVKIKEFLNKMIDTLKRFVKNSGDITQAQKDLIHIKQLYKKAFDDVKKNGTYSNEIKYSKKLGGYNPEINVSTKDIVKKFGINDINNLSEVQSKVYNKLLDSYISTSTQSKPIINIDTGMKIEIWKKGIKETFGNHSAYRDISLYMKKAKLATMNNLAKMIKYGEVRSAEAKNYHNPNSKVTFAYLTSPITIDGKKYNVDMDIRKTERGNRFYIHKIKMTDEVIELGLKNRNKLVTSSANNSISQNDDIVNNSILENADSDTKFSIAPEFESKYDNWDKENPNKVFVLGKTSNALKSIGLNDKLITMDSGKIIKIKNKHHNMTDEVIKNIPKVLENPVAIMKSKTKSNRITMFGSVTDTSGRPVLTILELSPIRDGYRLDEYKVASAYGKDNLQNLIDTSEILYIDNNKKRTTNLSNEFGLQLPLSFDKGSSSDSIISNDNTNVNNSILENSDSDTKFSIGEEKEKWQPIKPCEKTQKVLDRLAENKPVTLGLISELPEIAEAYSRRGDINPTININTEERKQLRLDIQKEVENLGSARLDNNGEWVYNGNIAKNSRIDIVIGLPAAGKSTVLANPLSATYQSRIVDSDIVKEKLPEFDNGYGADNVHEESKVINEQILKDAVINGENIVLPIVGSKYTKLLTQVMDFKTQGYSVYLHLNKLPMNKSLGRMLNRFLTDGRFLDPIISFKYQNKPTEVFDRIIKTKGEFLDGYSEYSNDVERGQDPIFIRGTENIQEAYKRTDKRISETDSENVRESGRNRGLSNSQTLSGEEEKKYSIASETEENLKSLNEQYGTKKKGENPVRDIDVPEKSSDNKRVREFVKTILESGALTDEMVNEVSDELVKDTLSYEPMSNENVLRVANEWLDNNGKGVTEKHWSDWGVISNGRHKVTALDIAKGELLLRSAAQNNDTQKVLKLTAEISEMATVAGQTVQAMRLLKKSTGLGQLYYAEKTVRRMNIDYETKYAKKGKKAPQIKINEDLALELAQAKTETQKEVAADKLYKDIGEQVPANWVDKWNAWRYMCMLTNPTTHIRNVVGNGIFMPAVATKNTIAYVLETISLRNGQEKTKAIKVKGEYKAFAEQDFDNVKGELTGNGKYEPTDTIQSNKIIFKTKWLEATRNFNGNFLEAEDAVFLKHHYKRALSMYLQANKIALNELSDIKAENARKAAIDKGRIYAIKEAQKATYRDASKLADAISQFSKSHKAAGVVIEGVIPFKKTPINVAKRAVEYSPAGLIKCLSWNSYQLYRGDITVAEYIDNISAGITGTGLVALGLFLGHLGAIKVGLGDDDKEQGLEKLEGHQEYSIELFGYSYTFDWACPAAIPIFIGAKAGEMLNEENEGLTVADYEDLTTTMLDPMFEMSVLSGIDNMIQNVKYSESPVVDTGLYAVSSYLGQAVPTLGGKIAGTIDGTRRSSYIDKSKDTFVSKNFTSSQQQFVNKIVKKIPGATYLLEPYVNEWGEQEKQDNVGVRIFQNFISPGYISKIEVDEVEKMLEDTYKESGNNTVLPTKSKKYFSVNGDTVHLTADEYTTYATVRGQMAHSILKDLSNNSDFKSAESADKASLISKAYELSNAIAKQGVSDYEPDGWIKKATEANERGMSYSDFLVMRERLNEISGEGTKEKRYNKIRRMNISKSAKEALWKSFNYDMALGGESINFY